MLRALGFEINLYVDVEGRKIDAKNLNYYSYDAQAGFAKISKNELATCSPLSPPLKNDSLHKNTAANGPSSRQLPQNARQEAAIYYGPDLFDIVQGDWSEASLKAAKRLTRQAFLPLLGGKPIKARELFL